MQFLVHITIEEFKAIVRETLKEVIREASVNSNISVEHESSEFMNIKQASAFLNLAINTIYEKTSQRIVPHFKNGNKLMFKRTELVKWLEDGKVLTQNEHFKSVEAAYQKSTSKNRNNNNLKKKL